MDRKLRDIIWLAGLLEGEGSFGFYNGGPVIQLKMTDLDIVERAHKALGCTSKVMTINMPDPEHSTAYKAVAQGSLAIGWMFTLYSLMGNRRKEQIKEVISQWVKHRAVSNPHRHKGNITVVGGTKVCSLHGPVTGINVRWIGKWVYCMGCYRPNSRAALRA